MKALPIVIENSPMLKVLTTDGASPEKISFSDMQLYLRRGNKGRYHKESRNNREKGEDQW